MAALTWLLAGPAEAAILEQTFSLEVDGQAMAATLALPEGPPAPVVLMLHGFGGSRNELPVATTKDGVFSRAARALADDGFASLRIDFRGSGQSQGQFADTTFEGQVEDALAAVAFLKADGRVAGSRLGILGWSQGGLVATAVAGRSGDGAIKAVALWAAVAEPKRTFEDLFGTDTLAAGLKTGTTPLSVTLPWGAVVALKQPFFDGIARFDPLKEIAAYHGPLFVAQGLKDTTVRPQSADALIAAHEGPEVLWTADMDHVFNAFSGPETLDRMIVQTSAFFKRTLK